VAFLGDSVTLGMLVPERDVFVRRLEPLLEEARGAPVETLNFGVDGYDARQIRRLLDTRVAEFEPDAVVYAVSLNDFDFWESSGEKALYFDPPAIFVARKLDRAWQRITRTDFHHYYYRKNRGVVLDEIAAMDASATARGAGFLAAVLPVFPLAATLGDDAARLEFVDSGALGDFSAYPFADVHDDLAGRLRARGIETVDLLDAFRADGRRPGELALDVWHPDAAGHAIIARALVEPVLALLPPARASEQGVDQRRGAGGAEHDQ
jgi:lysophospholipase L1-like esterase